MEVGWTFTELSLLVWVWQGFETLLSVFDRRVEVEVGNGIEGIAFDLDAAGAVFDAALRVGNLVGVVEGGLVQLVLQIEIVLLRLAVVDRVVQDTFKLHSCVALVVIGRSFATSWVGRIVLLGQVRLVQAALGGVCRYRKRLLRLNRFHESRELALLPRCHGLQDLMVCHRFELRCPS